MIGLLIFLGIVAAIVSYAVVTHKVIGIMDDAGCKGSFIEWLTALVPIVNLIMLIRNWSLLDRNTWKEQFETMSDKMKNERERHAKVKERSAKIGRELLND
jgi:uncharacterized membrane protein